MATKEAKFTITPGDGVDGYWIAVGNNNIKIVNGKGSVHLETDRKHLLVWWYTGNSGSSIKILGKIDGKTVVEVKKSKIPPGENEGAGNKRFLV